MVLNIIWISFFLIGFAVALLRLLQGDLTIFTQVLTGIFDTAKTGFDISLGLVGVMSLWLGIMKIGEQAGVIQLFARIMGPFFARIFPDVPRGHPAGGSMVMNFSANMLGLDNAATPLGLKAMRELQDLNPQKDTASNAMIMFLVLNTAGITLIPTSVIAIRQAIAVDQHLVNFNAADIFLPTLIGTFISFMAGLVAVAVYQRINLFTAPVIALVLGFVGLMAGVFGWLHQYPPEVMSQMIGLLGSLVILSIIVTFIAVGAWRRINVYESFVEGAKEGFGVAVQIIPYLVAILVAISVFRTTGCMDYVVRGIAAAVAAVGLPTDFVPALPVGLMKTLSGSGARGLMVDVMKTYGVDSFEGKLAAIIQGSTETTFYVLAVYFGSVNIRKTRYALTCGLIADAVGLVGTIIVGYWFFK
ncbi:nucleoside recognition domain-containing protein [Roseateles depolymerans]|uniref:Nucleoside recognition domain protein n=1 Tax=Roseateles depolymerans TaxID=76731 RepID=A0A0U3N9X2_9BURK|nr:spore maturation protein [Roseateles depolymerans]ALV08955.1 Nucleoside recognition domain protein [Roseateles depolymerans]REG10038.1 spore maturation protein SpmA [Roseateles depolymerans]